MRSNRAHLRAARAAHRRAVREHKARLAVYRADLTARQAALIAARAAARRLRATAPKRADGRPSARALAATRQQAFTDPQYTAAMARARAWRACGDHTAAGDAERDAASAFRGAWNAAAWEWDKANPEGGDQG